MENTRTFDRWFDEFLGDFLKRHPVDATFLGAHQFDHELPDFSREADADWIDRARVLTDQLDAITNDGLSEAQIYDRVLVRGFLELQRWEGASPFFQAGNPAYHTSEAVLGVVALFQRDAEPLDERVEAAMQRMRGLPGVLRTARQRVTKAPLLWTERAVREADAGVAYFGHGIRLLADERGIEQSDFLRQAEEAASAFEEHAAWLRDELSQRRIPFQPAGAEAFDRLLHLGHVLPVEQTTEWWFDYANTELNEATQELRELAHAIDWKRSWKQQLAELRFHHPSAAHYYQSFGDVWERCRQQANDAELVTWPDIPIEFAPIPRSDRQPAEALAYPTYRSPSPFGDRAIGRSFVPRCDPDMTPREQQTVLREVNDSRIKLHHVIRTAGLGRHVQSAFALHEQSRMGQIAGMWGARRGVMICGGTLTDGWAHYAAELMEEIGALTPAERLSEAHTRVHIAARAVVDTAIQSGEFSVERAARFYRDDVGLPATAALYEAVDNAMFPGHGVAALAGIVMIDELRRQMEDREGAQFTLQSFHDRLLSYGAIPVTLIAASMLGAGPTS
jgi:uncharacterized protein (DUF885 family)